MARIPTQELERLKQEVSLVRLVEARGVELRPRGRDLIGLCPFHDDHEPSLVVSPKQNLWHCLGACQAGGSVIDWVMKAEGVSFRHAVQILREDVLCLPSTPGGSAGGTPPKKSSVPKLAPVVEPSAEAQAALQQVVAYYHATLGENVEAQAYLEKRGLWSPEMVEHFKLGFANRTLCYRLPQKNRQAGAKVRGQLTELGILRESGHEHFAGSLVIPVFDEDGRVTEVYGRKINSNLRKGTPEHLYLPGPHRGVFNVEALKASDEVILCEALIDALTFWCAGYRNVTSAYGIEGFTKEHLEAFRRYGTKRVLIAYDRDEAGERAAKALAERLMSEGIECLRILFPRGMDANAYAMSVQPASRSLELAIKQAQWLGKGLGKGKAPAQAAGEGSAARAEAEAVLEAAKEEETPEAVEVSAEAGVLPAAEAAPEAVGEVSEPALVAREGPAAKEEDETPEAVEVSAEIAASVAGVVPAALGRDVALVFDDRRWRVRGLGKNTTFEHLRVNLLVSREAEDGGYFVDTLELYSARHRAAYIQQAAEELGVDEELIKRDLGQVLLQLEALQEQRIDGKAAQSDQPVELSAAEREAALELLRDPRLFERILDDFDKCGVVGERTNKLVGYLAAVSRKLDEPLAVVIQSSSAAGKSSLMEAVLSFVPDEERVKYSAMTGQSLFYMGETDLSHKVLAVVEEEGAERASYALKLLQSERELSIASTGKDPASGKLVTQEYRVEGPVAILLTTTAAEIDEELVNRCIVLSVDEEREQTRAIHRMQRERQTLEGLLAGRGSASVRKLHQDAQRLLRPLCVANPYAKRLTFLDDRTRTRRDHMKYLTLIRTIALLHQYQREVRSVEHEGKRVAYIEVSLEDIALANALAHEVLGRSLDELSPQTRRLLMLLEQMVQEACKAEGQRRSDVRFTRRQVREYTGWGSTQLKHHLRRLEDLEYVLVHRGGPRQRFVYELVYDGKGKDGSPFLPGLLDVSDLGHEYDDNWSGVNGIWSGSGRPVVGPWSAPGRGGSSPESSSNPPRVEATSTKSPKNASRGNGKKSYVLVRRSDSAPLEGTH
jgi:DNA primase catalytic core